MDPYVGITGFMSRQEAEQALDRVELLTELGYRLMIGVIASGRTIRGVENSWSFQSPKREEIAAIFPEHPATLNLIHLSSNRPDLLFHQLKLATKYGGPRFQGFQFNILWPLPTGVKRYRRQYPDKKLILQISPQLMPNGSIESILYNLALYQGIFDGVIVDFSRGEGQLLDSEVTLSYLRAIAAKFPELNMAIGGGLEADTLPVIKPILREFPRISLDAQNKLRHDHGALKPAAVNAYLLKAAELLAG